MPSTHTPHRVTPARPTVTAPEPDRSPVLAVLGVTVVSLAGSAVSVVTALSATWWDAVGPTGRLSVPLPMNLALVVLAVLAAGTRRRVALVAATLLTLACSVAVVSGFFDGGYAAVLTPLERATQVALVLSLAATAVVAARRARRLSRSTTS